jgi:hypothetical protein
MAGSAHFILVFRIALLVARFLDTVINDFNAYNLTNGVETDPQSQRRSSLAIPAEAFAQSALQPAGSDNHELAVSF